MRVSVFVCVNLIERSKSSVATADGMPTENISRMLSFSGRPAFGLKVIIEPFPMRSITIRKYKQATQFERHVARPAPNISCPFGRMTNIKRGSRAMFKRPPNIMPVPACLDMPTLRIRFESTFERTVGTPPATITHIAYCFAYSNVFSVAPRVFSSGCMNTATHIANAAETAMPR